MSDNDTRITRTPANRRAARIVTATIVAGGIALAGGTAYADADTDAPPPASTPAAVPATGTNTDESIDLSTDADQASREVFFAAGYTYDDAVVLGAQWSQDPWEAKVTGGEKLTAGETLPIAPGSSPTAPSDPGTGVGVGDDESAAVDAFFAAGYTYADAVALGTVWNVDPWEAKVTGGGKLLAGETLPVAP
ncbi:hypothetical protein ACFQ46_04080 [Kineococcus sp. GCM10028916]|uniref:hypothetical protein n=1 Tax=Kineococcus sp. GCM10028916 TaxID=3273394 RepID=UPI00362850E3